MDEQNLNNQAPAPQLARYQTPLVPQNQNQTSIVIQKSFEFKYKLLWIIIIILLFFVGFFGTFFVLDQSQNQAPAPTPTPLPNKPCTQEAMLCSDGATYVGRVGPNCEFAACPASSSVSQLTADWETYTNDIDGFSIKYPPFLNPNQCGGNLFNPEPLNDCVSQKPSLISVVKEDRSIDAYINEWDNYYNVAEASANINNQTYQQFNFSKKENAPPGPTQVDSVVVTVFPYINSNYIISYTKDAAPGQDFTKEYNLMLSTFKTL